MWGPILIFFSFVAAQVTSHEIKVECHEFHTFPPSSDKSPSLLADLRVELVKEGGEDMLNISWAINVDGSNEYLTGTRIMISGEASYHCTYDPVFAEACPAGSEQKWFHYLVKASYGSNFIQASNLPLPPPEIESYKYTRIVIPFPKITSKPTPLPTKLSTTDSGPVVPDVNFISVAVAIVGGLAGLDKSCGAKSTSLSFRKLPTSPPVPVLMVYPAENPAFQQAVVALAEFLQWHGGCSVAVDMWQQTKIAVLGPMRWLAEQAKAAHIVLIVCPQSSSQPSHSSPNLTFPEPSIPAAARDLYPLILNMVASHAKNTSDLAKFWVVKLGEQCDKKPNNLAPELRACKTFCLMKDLNKLCWSLHSQSLYGKKISDLVFRAGVAYSKKCTVALSEAVERLSGHQTSNYREVEPLKTCFCLNICNENV
ncbi:uncharacterized protein LOC121946961 isoform X2 [Plectropomus leopardus]|uniref:uncharacterized protein LOC121946961 isoform X2 n=1 Tax=Plectropomus leopardus TaxID=160734 RepID=UPI001C4AB8C7|nr:uncharacterized protein LOC121946961 isoform X2 [Plectropomus leopardus]